MQIQYLEPAADAYRAGACNIGPREIAKRRAFGIAGVAIAAALAVVLLVVDAPPLARALVVFPLWGGLISLEQARRKFCAGFAYAGIRSVTGSDTTERVTDATDKAADRAAARWLVAYCGAIAAVITAIFMLWSI
ncbi:MAG: hypothetical protein ACJ779_04900 [Chloroflexota bacterium]